MMQYCNIFLLFSPEPIAGGVNKGDRNLMMITLKKILFFRQNLSPEVWQFIREKKFMGMVMPKKFGGLGFR
jgi:alkylation response protein AidB-like acyl-CoA dehydrogenase